MSSILINSRFRNSWRVAIKEQARIVRSQLSNSDSGEPVSPAPAPSTVPPPPEEYGEVVRALSQYSSRNVPLGTISAILAANSAMLGMPFAAMYPAQYLSGIRVGYPNTLLGWGNEISGVPYICTEPFPSPSITEQVGSVLATPFPDGSMGKIVLSAYDRHMFWPRLIRTAEEITEHDTATASVHPREMVRMTPDAPALAFSFFTSCLRYTGCIRIATDDEIDHLFDTILMEGRLIRSNQINFRDLFSLMGISASATEQAMASAGQADREVVAPATVLSSPSAPQVTNVASPSSYPRLNPTRASRRNWEIGASVPPTPTLHTAEMEIPATVTSLQGLTSSQLNYIYNDATEVAVPPAPISQRRPTLYDIVPPQRFVDDIADEPELG